MDEDTLHMTLLYDTYGPLLTERQRRFVELYYGSDLSLGEIAQGHGVSRQAVYDILRRAAQTLNRFEASLGLVARLKHERRAVEQAEAALRHARSCAAALEGPADAVDGLQAALEEASKRLRMIQQGEEA